MKKLLVIIGAVAFVVLFFVKMNMLNVRHEHERQEAFYAAMKVVGDLQGQSRQEVQKAVEYSRTNPLVIAGKYYGKITTYPVIVHTSKDYSDPGQQTDGIAVSVYYSVEDANACTHVIAVYSDSAKYRLQN